MTGASNEIPLLPQLPRELQTQVRHQVQDGDTVGMEVLPGLPRARLPRRPQGPREGPASHARPASEQLEEAHR